MKAALMTLFRVYWKPLIAALALLVLVLWTTGVGSERIKPGTLPHLPGRELPTDAAVQTVQIEEVPVRVAVVGSVTSENIVQISARVGAYVAEVLASAGDVVEKGQVLIRLDDRDLQARILAAEAEFRRLERDFERMRNLHEANVITDQQVMAAEAAFLTASATLDEARVQLSFSEIRSPQDGIVTDRHIEVGQLAHAGQALLSVFDPTMMRLDVPVPSRLVPYLSLGDGVMIDLDQIEDQVPGTVHRVVSEIDPRSRTQMVQIMIETGDRTLLPGTFGRLLVPTRPRLGIWVPDESVYRIGQLQRLQIVDDGRVLSRLITTGVRYGGRTEVLSGLSDGEQILIQPLRGR